jgi:hypothetical protein
VWNYYHRQARPLYVREYVGGAGYAGPWRYFNNNASNKVDFVVGVAGEPLLVMPTGELSGGSGTAYVSWDPDGGASGQVPAVRAGAGTTLQASAVGLYTPAVGYHYLALTQFGSGTASFEAGQLDAILWA